MLKIVHKICCGIDVHKKFVVATVGITNKQGVTDYETRTFQTFTENLVQLREWLAEKNCVEVCMESTGKYWIPIFNILEDTCRVFVANPKYVKGIRGKKTDKRDSLWLCDLHKHGLVQNSFIPPWRIRQIRDLMRYRYKRTNFKSSEKNRAQNSKAAWVCVLFDGECVARFFQPVLLCFYAASIIAHIRWLCKPFETHGFFIFG